MNIFEDLIEELKEENLLEETVIEVQKIKEDRQKLNFQAEKTGSAENINEESFEKTAREFENSENAEFTSDETEWQSESEQNDLSGLKGGELEKPETFQNDLDLSDFENEVSANSEKSQNQAEFYKKRATDEVTSLQMVEHVLSGVERDFLKIEPKLYDDLEVKKALHIFLQFSQNINSPEQAHAEFILMQETEGWYSALSQKDKNINVGNLRRYCETTRPALSSQALAALARFYRNAPFSETVRSKFDQVITRFFARETGGDIRKLSLSRDEVVEKLNEFYAEWSSIPLYAAEEDESNIVLAAVKFEDFMAEAEAAEHLEELVQNDFFNRLQEFKEGTHENFFAPLVTVSAIESNIRIGNRYIELLLKERENSDVENIEEKYGIPFDHVISELVCKTIYIANVFEGKFAEADIIREPSVGETANLPEFEKQDLNKQPVKSKSARKKAESKNSLFKVNKWLLAVAISVVIASVGLYLYVEYFNPPPELSANVKIVNLENSSLKEYVETARINGDMFYGVVAPTWDSLTNDKKEEFLNKIVSVGGEKGFVRVTLLNKQGRSVGYGTPEKVEVYNP